MRKTIIFIAFVTLITTLIVPGKSTDFISGDASFMDNNEKMIVRVYPNPTFDKFTISLNGDYEVKLYDLVGQQLDLEATTSSQYTSQDVQYTYNLGHLPNGIYFVKVTNLETKSQEMIKVKKI